jgi:aspartate/methionine/tyrosine aminotransferase
MAGFLEHEDLTPNPIDICRQQHPDAIDLTSSNPTRNGLLFPADVLAAAAAPYWATRRYQPHARGIKVARQAVAHYYGQRVPAVTYHPDHDIVMTASTSEAYVLLFALLTDPGDNVLVPDISYPLFDYLAAMYRIELRTYPLDAHRGWRIDPWQLGRASDERTRAVLIVSPHNPTGAVIRQAIPMLSVLQLPVICDEVFADMPYTVPHVPPLAALMPHLPIFTLNGISKMCALPDLKLGWIAMTPAARDRYAMRLEVLNDTLLGANMLVQTMLPHILQAGQPFIAMQRAHIQQQVALVLDALAPLACVRVRPPDAGYYVFVQVLTELSDEALVLALIRHGVFVHPGFFFGVTNGCYIVISALVAQPHLTSGLQRLVAGIRHICGDHAVP